MKFTLKAVSNFMNRRPRLCFGLLVVTGILFMIAWGKFKSSINYHVDELWQYSFANSNGKLTNVVEPSDYFKWLPASTFNDYITVQPAERFAFSKITEATSRDIHPPLSHYALHVASSLSPDTFSKWFGLSVNILSYALTIASLYYLALTLFGCRQKALLASALWAFSLGAINTVMYIRMYCMLTLFTVSVAAFTLRYMKTGNARLLIPVYASFILGGLTDYIFWIFGFFLTLAFIIVRLRKHFRQAFAYAAVALAGFLTVCALFPATYKQFINANSLSRRATNNFGVLDKIDQAFDLHFVLNRFLTFSSDQSFFVPANIAFTLILLMGIGILAIPLVTALVSAVACQVLKDAPASAMQISDSISGNWATILTQAGRIYLHHLKNYLRRVWLLLSRRSVGCCLLIATALTTYTMAVIFPDFDIWTGRAFFFLYPFFALLLAYILFILHERARVPAIILVIVTLALLTRELTLVRPPFLFRGGYEKLVNKLKDANVIFVLDSVESSSRLTNFCPAFKKANSILVMPIVDENYRIALQIVLASADKSRPLMIINTIGRAQENDLARSLMGDEMLLTNDARLTEPMAQQGFQLNLMKHGAQLFQWFNLYQVSPLNSRSTSSKESAPNKETTPPPATPAPA